MSTACDQKALGVIGAGVELCCATRRPFLVREAPPAALALARPLPPSFAGGGDPSFVLGASDSQSRTTVVLAPEPSLVLDCESQKPRTKLGSPPSRPKGDTGGARTNDSEARGGRLAHQKRPPRCITQTPSPPGPSTARMDADITIASAKATSSFLPPPTTISNHTRRRFCGCVRNPAGR